MPVTTKPLPAGARQRLSLDKDLVAAAGACLIAILLTFPLVRLPGHVAQVQVRNPGGVGVDVLVHGGGGASVPLGAVEAGRSSTVESVVDQGSTWIFEFEVAGRPAGRQTMSREELEDAGWTMTVPESVGENLARAPGRESNPLE